MPQVFLVYFWAGPVIWAALFVSDYFLTLACARMYQGWVKEKISFEGSYELTPQFQRDIDNLRRVSPRFIYSLLLTISLLVLLWELAGETTPELYFFVLGALISIQLAIHIRHLRNFFIFRAAVMDTIDGHIEYRRVMILQLSALEMASFAGMFLVLFIFTRSWFILGGAVGCLSVAVKHWRFAKVQNSAATVDTQTVG